MPGVNLTGKPQTSDLVLGRGSVHFALLDATTKKPLGFRHLGNCTNLSLTMDTEVLEHFSSRSGIRSIDREIALTQKLGVNLTLDENSYQNLALWFAGAATAAVTNPALSNVGTTTPGVTEILISSAAYEGFTYELVNAAGARLMDTATGTLVVKSHATTLGSAATLALGADYEHDTKWGLIFLKPGGAHVDGNKLWFSYATASNEKPIDTVDLLTTTSVTGFLRFISINAANSDKQEILDLHSVRLKADGEMPRISDEFSTMSFVGSAERNEIGYPTSPVGKFYFHADA